MAIALALSAAPFVSVAGSTEATPHGLWIGYGHAVRTANLGLVTVGCVYDSQFWFVVSADSTISGEATVSYELNFSDAQLRTLIAHANWAGNAAIGLIPGLGSLIGASVATRDILGMQMRYQEAAPVRKGRIGGQLANGQLRLRWANPPPPLTYQQSVVYPLKERPSKSGDHPAYAPWIDAAVVLQPQTGRFVALTAPEQSRRQNGDTTVAAIWSAHKVF